MNWTLKIENWNPKSIVCLIFDFQFSYHGQKPTIESLKLKIENIIDLGFQFQFQLSMIGFSPWIEKWKLKIQIPNL